MAHFEVTMDQLSPSVYLPILQPTHFLSIIFDVIVPPTKNLSHKFERAIFDEM